MDGAETLPGASSTTTDSHPTGHEPPQMARRPAWVTASGIILFVVAGISILIAMTLLIFGLLVGPRFAEMVGLGTEVDGASAAVGGMITGVMIAFGVIAVVWAGAHTAAGIGILAGRDWARILGIVLAVMGLLVSLLFLAGSLGTASDVETVMGDPAVAEMYPGMTVEQVAFESILFGLLFTVPFIIGYVVVLVTMLRSGAFFGAARRLSRQGR